jgi:hypothetical protein
MESISAHEQSITEMPEATTCSLSSADTDLSPMGLHVQQRRGGGV